MSFSRGLFDRYQNFLDAYDKVIIRITYPEIIVVTKLSILVFPFVSFIKSNERSENSFIGLADFFLFRKKS